MIDLQASTTEVACWNKVSQGSYEHEVLKMPIGEVIGSTRDDCLERVRTPILHVLTNRAWVDAALARWTNVTTTIRRFLFGALISRVIPLVLEDIRVGLSLTDEIEVLSRRC